MCGLWWQGREMTRTAFMEEEIEVFIFNSKPKAGRKMLPELNIINEN